MTNRKPVVAFGITQDQRREIMLSLRNLGVSDQVIGDVFGVTRERVAQIVGRHGTKTKTEREVQASEIVSLYSNPPFPTFPEISEKTGMSVQKIQGIYLRNTDCQYRQGVSKVRAIIRKERQKNKARSELMEFIPLIPKDETMTHFTLRRLGASQGLISRAEKIQPFTEWRREFGLAHPNPYRRA